MVRRDARSSFNSSVPTRFYGESIDAFRRVSVRVRRRIQGAYEDGTSAARAWIAVRQVSTSLLLMKTVQAGHSSQAMFFSSCVGALL